MGSRMGLDPRRVGGGVVRHRRHGELAGDDLETGVEVGDRPGTVQRDRQGADEPSVETGRASPLSPGPDRVERLIQDRVVTAAAPSDGQDLAPVHCAPVLRPRQYHAAGTAEFEAIGQLGPGRLVQQCPELCVKGVRWMLGHASAKLTLDRYGHLWPGCPASRRWQGFGLGKGDDRGVCEALVAVDRAVSGRSLVGPDRVELDPVGLGLAGQVEGVVDGLAVEPLVLKRLESPLPDAVLAG